jgi:hemerythrin superfamily protein
MSDTRFLEDPDGSVLTVLHAQHDRVRALLAEVRDAEDPERGAAAFEALRELLAAHETAEELVLRPVSVQVIDRSVTAARNREEHAIVKLLAELEGIDVADAQFRGRFAAFERAVVEHLSREEAEEFPLIEQRVDPHESGVMARWIERATAAGPTHAHPAAVGSPMAQRVVAPFASLLDRARDLFDGSRDEDETAG